MTCSEIIAGLKEKFGLRGLEAKNGSAALEIDGMPILLEDADRALNLTGIIGEEPPEGASAFANMLLEANIGLMVKSSMAIARNQQSMRYMLVERLDSDGLDVDKFCSEFEIFITSLESWRKICEAFRPAALAATGHNAEEPSPLGIGSGGFMSV